MIGSLSDKTPGTLGRRPPYIMIGGLLVVLSTPLLVTSGNAIIFLIGLSLLLVGRNTITPAYQGLIPDRVPKEQRGTAAGYVGGLTILGSVVSLGLAGLLLGEVNQLSYSKSMIRFNTGIYYIVTAIIMLIGVLITVIGIRELPFIPGKREPRDPGVKTLARFSRWFAHTWVRPWRSRNFALVFLTRTLIMTGLAMFMTFIEYYFARVQHVQNFVQATAIVAILALGGGVVSGLVFAPLLGSLIINIAASYGQTALGYRLVFTAATILLITASMSILLVREK